MTISKRIKGKKLHKNEKTITISRLDKKYIVLNNEHNKIKNWPINIRIEFDDEYLNNSLQLNNILK